MSDTPQRLGLRLATIGVVVFIAAITVIGTIATHRTVHSEERNLLRERASELGLILTDSFSALQTELATTAAETRLNGANAAAFNNAAANLIQTTPGATTVLARATGSTGPVRYLAATGATPPSTVGPRAALIRRALTLTPAAVTSAVFPQGTSRTLGLAYPVGTGDLVIYEEISINPQLAGSATAQGQPFRELNVALYVGARQDPSTLVLTTGGRVPLTGEIAVATTPFGADKWLVAIQAITPLVGSFAAHTYWIVLAGGLVLAVAFGALVEALLRRRDYAMTLVAERTDALAESVVQLERTQEQLVRSERLAAIGELASAVGHELRNPLGVITNAHFLLRAQLRDADDTNAARHLATAEREVGAATLIVSDLLDFARAREPVKLPVDVADLFDEVMSVIPAPAGIVVEKDLASDVPLALADRDQLRQVLLNLLTNAYEAMPDGGQVTITVRPDTDRLVVTISDTGIGMDPETAARVFDPFFTRKARGIGLGLAVTKRIVDSHGGAISVESAPGAGSTFRIEMPMPDQETPS